MAGLKLSLSYVGLLSLCLLLGQHASSQPCLTGYSLTASVPPNGGTYGCGETVTFCLTVSGWNTTNANWFHGVTATFGPGWDLSTLTPGPPPATAGTSAGTWGWYNSVQGTAGTSIGPQGPGFFFDLNNDGNPGNNFGDYATGSWTFCWTISVLSGPACINGLGLGVTVNTFGDSETGSWGSAGCGGDVIVPSQPAVIQACSANAGTGGPLALCSTSGVTDLFSLLAGAPDNGGAWTDPTGMAHSGMLDPSADVSGDYTYTVGSVSPPCSASATISVSIALQPDAGADATLTLCTSDQPVDLFSILGGSPDPAGSWNGPGGAMSGMFDPSSATAGVYTYVLSANAPCMAASALVTVSVSASSSAGADGALTVCGNGSPVSMVSYLAGAPDLGGIWTDPSGAVASGTYTPGVSPAGPYSYTVSGIAPCPNSVAVLSITENQQPDAGANAVVSFCESDSPQSLIVLLGGTPNAGGTWQDPNGSAMGPTIDPGTASSGNYTYSITATPPCTDVAAVVTITISSAPYAGTSGSLVLCETMPLQNLFAALIDADSGGSWTGPDGSASNGQFNPLQDQPGLYTYSTQGNADCPADQSTVDVAVFAQPSAGQDASIELCSTSNSIVLLSFLSGSPDPGGVWSDPAGAIAGTQFTPGTSLDGDYTYVIAGNAGCPGDESTLTITTTAAPDAGTDGDLSLCESGATTDLFSALNGTPEPGGTWTNPNGMNVGPMLNPSTGVSGSYTYTLPAVNLCPEASASVSVSIASPPEAGIDGTLTLCSSNLLAASLTNALGGAPDAGGTWAAPNGAPHGASFSVSTDAAGVYTYTVSSEPPCPSASSTVAVSVTQAVDAGVDMVATLCSTAPLTDLSGFLSANADPSGTWTGPTGGISGSVDPSITPSGNFTYTVSGTAPCPSDQSILSLTIDQMPSAGSPDDLDLCADADPINLLNQLAGVSAGGAWAGPSGPFSGWFDPASQPSGTYTYSVNGTGACTGQSDASDVLVDIHPLPVPSFSSDIRSGCAPLQVQFSNSSPNGLQSNTWSFGDGNTASETLVTWHVYSTPGLYSPMLTVTDTNSCSASTYLDVSILVSDGPMAQFYALPLRVSVGNPTTTIAHEAAPWVSYIWTIDGNVLDTSGGFAWTFDPPTIGDHEICLTAIDTLGCLNTLCQRVLVDDDLTIYVANAFTPNDDGTNDGFRPSVIGVEQDWYEFMVFDRWGLLVFRTTDPQETWNGSMENAGGLLPQDVYVWTLRAKDQFTPEKAELVGTVTLLR